MAEAINPSVPSDTASASPKQAKPAQSPHQHLQPMSGMPLAITTFALSMAVFMMVLDSTIANVALPTIAGDLGAATSQGTWVITMFAVSNAISIPLTGWLARQFGSVKVFLWSASLFVFCSWLCGVSHSLPMLIIARMAQGAVAGPMIPLSQSLLMQSFPLQKRALALGLFSMVVVTAPILGPILGGYLVDNYHWGWIFFINIPIGVVAIILAWQQLKDRETPIVKTDIDKIGLMLLVIGVGALQFFLDRGRELDWFASPEIIVLATVSILCLGYLVIWERGETHPIVDLSLFQDRNFTIGTLVISLAFLVYMGAIVLLPVMLQQTMGYTSVWAGLAAAPIGFFPVLLTPIIGKYARNMDMRILVTLSFLVYWSTFWWRSHFNPQMDYWDVFWPQFMQGLGTAMFFMPLTAISLSNVPPQKMASATGLFTFVRTLAGGIGASLVMTVWERRSIEHHAYLSETATLGSNAQAWLAQMQASGMSQEQALVLLNQQITQQSMIIGSNDVFYGFGMLFLLLIGLIWLAKPPFHH
ncbi:MULTISPECIES: DHA2 family efflux MFS transporter permease subunit [unclassified Moraxella]|uniref:DHA2 family efflux MFS transporter permease subunit n=1 Tax=unclassified Moraxella TaxID=2685852 RepID=UPI003AF8A909